MGILCDCTKKDEALYQSRTSKANTALRSFPFERSPSVNSPMTNMSNIISPKEPLRKKEANDLLNKYELTELYKSQLTIIYKGKCKELDNQYRLIKIINLNIIDPKNSSNLINQITSDLKKLQKASHPQIVKIYEINEYNNYIYITEEYVEGVSLKKLLGTAKINDETTKGIIMFQYFSILNFLHTINIFNLNLEVDDIIIEKKQINGYLSIKLLTFHVNKYLFCSKRPNIRDIDDFNLKYNYQLNIRCPEYAKGIYQKESDIWDSGIILYLMFMNKYPFEESINNQNIKLIEKNKLGDEFMNSETISQNAKSLVSHLLLFNPFERIKLSDALDHPWFQYLKIKQKLTKLNPTIFNRLLSNINRFKITNKLQRPILSYIIKNFEQNNEYVVSSNILFSIIEENNNGFITEDEFINKLSILINEQQNEEMFEYISNLFHKIDIDNLGKVGNNELCIAAIDKKQLLKNDLIKNIFDYLDREKAGKIKFSDVCKEFGKDKLFDSKEFKKFFVSNEEIDVIKFHEFQSVFKNIIR